MRVLFLCSGNVFRSVAAEYCLRDYIVKNNILGIVPGSAGINAEVHDASRLVLWELMKLGINARHHVPEQLNKRHLWRNNLIIPMGRNHKDYLKKYYNLDTQMFNEFCHGVNAGVLDIDEAVVDFKHNRKAMIEHIKGTIKHINSSIPNLVRQLQNKG